jgi:hypothetical protein
MSSAPPAAPSRPSSNGAVHEPLPAVTIIEAPNHGWASARSLLGFVLAVVSSLCRVP